MEALKAVGLSPISVLSERKAEPRKFLSLPTNFPLKFSLPWQFPTTPQNSFSLKSFHGGGLVFLSTIITNGFAKALTYEEALKQISPSGDAPFDIDLGGFFDGATNFATDNPVAVIGGAAVLAVPLVVSRVFAKSKPWGVESAKTAYAKLGDDSNAQLLDIRARAEVRQVGSPDVGGLKKKAISVVYKGEDKTGFLKKLALKFKEPENTTLFILDKFDGSSELVAELVTANGFKAAYAIKDGAEGTRGWMNSGLPWILPKKLSFDLNGLTDAIGEGPEAISLALGVAVAAGLGFFAFSEVEIILELLGSAALVQFISKKLLFAEDRKQTLEQVDEFLTTKVAPKELVAEIVEIGKAFLPSPVTSKALPAPAEASPAEAVTETNSAPPKVESAATPTPQVNSVPATEVESESFSEPPRPLSPYPSYPDLRPPSSPTPSKP